MKRILATLVMIVAFVPAVQAEEPAATEASVRELMQLIQAQKLTEGMTTQVDALMQSAIKQALGNQTITAEQQQALDDMRVQMRAVMKDELGWDKMEPMMIDIYEKSFSQHEVEGMIAFYKTDVGQAVIAKMPVVMQYSVQAAQARMAEIMPRLQAMQRETIAKIKAPAPDKGAQKQGAAVNQG